MSTALEADVVVVGLGAMGSAAVFHLAQRNKSVLGLVSSLIVVCLCICVLSLLRLL
jgi:hypothetical protein